MIGKILITLGLSWLMTQFLMVNPVLPFGMIIYIMVLAFIHKHLEASILFFALYFPFNNFIVFKMGIADLRFIQMFWPIILMMIFLKIALKQPLKFKIKFEMYDLFFVGFLLLCVLQLFLIKYPILTFREMIQWTHYFSLFIVLRSFFREKEYVHKFYKGITIATVIFIIFAIYKLTFGVPPIKAITVGFGGIQFVEEMQTFQATSSGNSLFSRVDSFFWGSVGTANILLIMYFLNGIKPNKKKIPLMFITIILIIATASRAGWVTFYSLFLLNALVERKFFFKLTLSFFGFFLCLTLFPWMVERLMDIFSHNEASNQYHLAIWSGAIEMFKTHMLLGVGTGHFIYNPILFANQRMYNLPEGMMTPHNIFLKILAENGIFGFLLLFLFALMIVQSILKNIHFYKDVPQRYVLLAFIATSMMNLTMNAVMIEAFWILMALFMAIQPSTSKQPILTNRMNAYEKCAFN